MKGRAVCALRHDIHVLTGVQTQTQHTSQPSLALHGALKKNNASQRCGHTCACVCYVHISVREAGGSSMKATGGGDVQHNKPG